MKLKPLLSVSKLNEIRSKEIKQKNKYISSKFVFLHKKKNLWNLPIR